MANRVLLGNRATGGYGLYVSKATKDVLTCSKDDLIFDSTQKIGGTGEIYAGGKSSSVSNGTSINFLSTGSKDNLGYPPLVLWTEDNAREWNDRNVSGAVTTEQYTNNIAFFETSSSEVTPCYIEAYTGSIERQDRRDATEAGSGGTHACTNLTFQVLKIPCAYGYMNSTYFTEG